MIPIDFTSHRAAIRQLLPVKQSDLNPSQAVLVSALNLNLRPKVIRGIDTYSGDKLKDYSFLLLTLSANPELGDELRTKVNEYALALFQTSIDCSSMNTQTKFQIVLGLLTISFYED
jgi:hypothetical protein